MKKSKSDGSLFDDLNIFSLWYTSLWDTVKGSPPDLKGKTLTVILLLAIRFLPTITLPGRGIPLAERW